jgi:PAS domain S-box-containing protein
MSARAQSVLSTIEDTFLRFIESVPDSMVLSNRDGRVVLVNANTEKLFGYSRDQLLGKSVETLIPPRLRARHRIDRARYLSDPGVRPMAVGREVMACHKDGHEFPVEINLSPIELGGEVFVWSAVRDARERDAAMGRLHVAMGVHARLIQICAWCKRVREERGKWETLEQYVASHLEAKFTHGLCCDCLDKLDPNHRPVAVPRAQR